jgi:hypothetical protein
MIASAVPRSLHQRLLAGVLYSLVALGFVLIFKASGVFNFAQGAMVLLAAWRWCARSICWCQGLSVLAASSWARVRRRHHGDHGVAGGALRARAAGQSGRPDAVHVDHRRHLHARRRRADAVRLRRLSAALFPTTPGSCSRSSFRAASWSTSSTSGAG